jgi:uncharacterized lipoprotein YehR (DUF1307 family)
MKPSRSRLLPIYIVLCIISLSSCSEKEPKQKKYSSGIVAEETKEQLEQENDTTATNIYQ